MAVLQLINVLNATDNYPGPTPTAASPSPTFGLSSAITQGVYPYTTSSYPTVQSKIEIVYFTDNQRCTGQILASQTAEAIISAS